MRLSEGAQAPRNRLLAALPGKDYQHLLPQLEAVPLDLGQVLCESGDPMRHVYFPNEGVVSTLAILAGGASVEVGTIGKEGVVGLPVFLEAESAPLQFIVQIRGDALRTKVDVFRSTIDRDGRLHHLLHLYTSAFLTQVAQSVACNTLHAVEKRCGRWLLMAHDRMSADEFPLTQEFLAQMLSVRRATVTEVAGKLQKAGLIRYNRGWITILDRKGLESAFCECYRIVKDEFDRLLGDA